ncbi:MAG: hypothetical protein KGH61_05315, partial [Candidatus Micrarchaeota archaeon]|nr:hypothetical protein [Candidatus Micrarchaeota archaeon]
IMQRSINLLYFDSLILLVMVVSLDQKSNRRCKILRFTLVSEDFYKTLKDIIEEHQSASINKYSFVADTVNPDGILYFFPIISGKDMETALKKFNSSFGSSINISATIGIEIIFGSLGYRLFDTMYSLQSAALNRDYGIKTGAKIDYYQSGRKSALGSKNRK